MRGNINVSLRRTKETMLMEEKWFLGQGINVDRDTLYSFVLFLFISTLFRYADFFIENIFPSRVYDVASHSHRRLYSMYDGDELLLRWKYNFNLWTQGLKTRNDLILIASSNLQACSVNSSMHIIAVTFN